MADVAEYSRKLRVIPARRPYDAEPESLPLGAMYGLAAGDSEVKFERLSRRDAAMEVLAHAYRVDPADRAGLEAQLDAVAAGAPDVWRVSYPRDLARAPAVARAIAAHAVSLSGL
jgi:hypothetical protein